MTNLEQYLVNKTLRLSGSRTITISAVQSSNKTVSYTYSEGRIGRAKIFNPWFKSVMEQNGITLDETGDYVMNTDEKEMFMCWVPGCSAPVRVIHNSFEQASEAAKSMISNRKAKKVLILKAVGSVEIPQPIVTKFE